MNIILTTLIRRGVAWEVIKYTQQSGCTNELLSPLKLKNIKQLAGKQ